MIAGIIARIKTQCPEFGGRVEGPSQAGALERTAYPIAIVYPISGSLGGEFGESVAISRQYGIEITADATEIESAVASCLVAIHGYKPAGCLTPFAYAGDRTKAIEGSLVQILMTIAAKTCIGA